MNLFQLFSSKFTMFILASTLTLTSTHTKTKTLIFDFNGVLANVSRLGIAKEMGLGQLTWYAFAYRSNPKTDFFQFLENEFGTQKPEKNCQLAGGDGHALPKIMCDWMTGKPGKDIIESIINHIDENELINKSFKGKVFKAVAKTIFNPQTLVKHTHPIKGVKNLLQRCFKKGNRMLLLSNYADDAFQELYKKEEFNVIFKHIAPQDCIISGICKVMKPYKSIFDYLENFLTEHNLEIEECIFIDDQIENIEAARAYGLESIHFTGNYKKLKKQLKERGAL